MSDWFSSFAAQAIQFADNLADSLVTQAAEAQHQIEVEQNKLKTEEFQKEANLNCYTNLPWETSDESQAILSQELMENILKLSVHDTNFCTAAANSSDIHFNFREFVPTAMRLLQLDSNLARIHSKLSPKMDEEVFWFNYYCRIVYLRQISGIDGPHARLAAARYNAALIVSSNDIPMSDALNDPKIRHDNDSTILHSVNAESVPLGAGTPAIVTVPGSDEEQEELDLDCLGDLDCGDLEDLDLLDLDDLDEGEEVEDEQRTQARAALSLGETASSTVTDFEKVRTEDCRPSSSSGSGDVDSDAELEAQIARELAAEG